MKRPRPPKNRRVGAVLTLYVFSRFSSPRWRLRGVIIFAYIGAKGLVFTKNGEKQPKDKREITSSMTHPAGALLAAVGLAKLAYDAWSRGEGIGAVVSVAVFGASMVLLYCTSSLYHWCCAVHARAAAFMQRLDHMAIFLLIAGTYTPVCVLRLGPPAGYVMLALVWGVAAAGFLVKIFWMEAPVWLSCAIYIAMGWLAAFFIVPLWRAMSAAEMAWLVAGGLLYTAGAVIFALERPRLKFRWFGPHELFHLFVMGGSLCHYITIAGCVA